MGEDSLGAAECGLRLAAGGGGEGLHLADHPLVLGVFAGAQVRQAGQHGLSGGGVAAQRRQPAPAAGEELIAGQRVGIGGLGELGVGGVPVAEHQQRLGQVAGR